MQANKMIKYRFNVLRKKFNCDCNIVKKKNVFNHRFHHITYLWYVTLKWIDFVIDQEEGVDITANSLHPGAIITNIFRHTHIVSGN